MKRTWLIVAAVSTLAVGLAAFAASGTTQPEVRKEILTWAQAAPTDGETLYLELCASCHGAEATGNGPAAPALAQPAPDLTRLAERNGGKFPVRQVERTIAGTATVAAHGDLHMPIWGHVFRDVRPDRKMGQRQTLADVRIRNLAEYLETLQAGADGPGR